MNKIAASEIDRQRVVCKMLDWSKDDGPTDDRPAWLLEREGRLVKPCGHRVWVRFLNPHHDGIRDPIYEKQFVMSWRELAEEAGNE